MADQDAQTSSSSRFISQFQAGKAVSIDLDLVTKYISGLRLTNPRDIKTHIEKSNDHVFNGAHKWFLDGQTFTNWRDVDETQVLCIEGGPGQGKTTLLMGIVDDLSEQSDPNTHNRLISYFFCEGANSASNHATAVLRGLMYLLLEQKKSLILHLRKNYDYAARELCDDPSTFNALSNIFTKMLDHPDLAKVYLIVDGLDECQSGLPRLLDLIVSTSSSQVKWLVSSSKRLDIKEKLGPNKDRGRISLELDEDLVSTVVKTYIDNKVLELTRSNQYDNTLQDEVKRKLYQNSRGNFLWVSLICEELRDANRGNTLLFLEGFPSDLQLLYNHMLGRIQQMKSETARVCLEVLTIALLAYEPLHLEELALLADLPNCDSQNSDSLRSEARNIVLLCRPFLRTQGGKIFFVHQSAKDYLSCIANTGIFHPEQKELHLKLVSRSLQIMSSQLRRDLCSLKLPGASPDEINPLNLGPLAFVRYCCRHWVNHIREINTLPYSLLGLNDGGVVHVFLQRHLLHWLEALSIMKSSSSGVAMIIQLEELLAANPSNSKELLGMLRDAIRFVLYNREILDRAPLQLYASAMIFSPALSKTRSLFKDEEALWISKSPLVEENWSREIHTLNGHTASVRQVSFSHDGRRLVSRAAGGGIRVWDSKTGALLYTLEISTEYSIGSVTFSHDDRRLASTSDNGICLWDAETGALLRTLEDSSFVYSVVAFSYDGRWLASASDASVLCVWDTETGERQQSLEDYLYFSSLACSYDSRWLASGSSDSRIWIWDTKTGELATTLEGHTSRVNSVSFSCNNRHLASGSEDRTVRIWDIEKEMPLLILEGHNGEVNSVAFSHDGKWLASSSDDKAVRVWDAETGVLILTLESHSERVNFVAFSHNKQWLASTAFDKDGILMHTTNLEGNPCSIKSIAFSPDNKSLASSSDRSEIFIWEVETGMQLTWFDSYCQPNNSVTFSPDGKWLAYGSDNGGLFMADPAGINSGQSLEGHTLQVNSVVFSSNGCWLASGSSDETACIWNIEKGNLQRTFSGHGSPVNAVNFSYNGMMLVFGSDDGLIRTWDVKSGELLQILEGHTAQVSSVLFSVDGQWVISGSSDNTARIWDRATGVLQHTLEGHTGPVSSVAYLDRTAMISNKETKELQQTFGARAFLVNTVAFSSDDELLASSSLDMLLRIWDTETGELLHTLKGGGLQVNRVMFSWNGRWLVSGSQNQTVRIWDGKTGVLQRTFEDFKYKIESIALTNDGVYLMTSFGSKGVRVWDAETGRLSSDLGWDSEKVSSVAFSDDQEWAGCGTHDGTVQIWRLVFAKLQETIEGHNGAVKSVAFSHDSERLAAGSADYTIRIWKLGIWEVPTTELLYTLGFHVSPVNSLIFSYDDCRLVSGSEDGRVYISDIEKSQLIELRGHAGPVSSVMISHNNSLVASGSCDLAVRIWDAETGLLLHTVGGHNSPPTILTFSQDDLQLASSSLDDIVQIWDTETGAQQDVLWHGTSSTCYSVAFSPDRRQLASGWHDKIVRIWDIETGLLLQMLEGHTSLVHSVAFAHRGHWIASTSPDNTVRLWDAVTGAPLLSIDIPFPPKTISFSLGDSYLNTEEGPISLYTRLPNSARPPKRPAYSLSEDKSWITYRGKKVLWLPPKYRPLCWQVKEQTIAIGCSSGRVLLIGFNPAAPKTWK